jgi:mannose-6-phosphate isomerase
VTSENVRPWGHYEVLQSDTHHQVKCVWINPGKRLSYQRHQFRAEHWLIISGHAEVTLDDVTINLGPGESIDIPIMAKHRISAPRDEVVFVEVQTGTSFDEDDIERFEDDYGRAN